MDSAMATVGDTGSVPIEKRTGPYKRNQKFGDKTRLRVREMKWRLTIFPGPIQNILTLKPGYWFRQIVPVVRLTLLDRKDAYFINIVLFMVSHIIFDQETQYPTIAANSLLNANRLISSSVIRCIFTAEPVDRLL